ncbi:MAG: hypothetical protein QXT98_03140, partial [Archaeoglobaceae archaeon]
MTFCDFSELIGCEAEIYRDKEWFFIHIVGNSVGNFGSIPSENKNPQLSNRKSSHSKNREFKEGNSTILQLENKAGREGFEPTTAGLRVPRS